MSSNENVHTGTVFTQTRWVWIIIGAVFVLVLMGGGYYLRQLYEESKNIPQGRMAIGLTSKVYVVDTRGERREIIDLDPNVDDPAWSADGGQLAYAKRVLGNQDIYVANADGSGEQRLTDNASVETSPSWLPDATRIVFASDRDGDNEIYIMDANGSNVQALTNDDDNDMEPDVSPDGTQIVFTHGHDIYKMAVDGSNMQQLTDGKGTERMPEWSPDGTQIAYVQYDGDEPTLYIMNADGPPARRVLMEWRYLFNPTWSPDGTRLAFIGKSGGGAFDEGQLYVAEADGSSVYRLSESYDMRTPAWSPDGSQIATSWIDRLTMVEAFLTPPKTILRVDEGFLRDVKLSPDGSQLVFIRDHDVHTMAVDGEDSTPLTQTDAREASPAWSADGAQIVFVSDADGDNALYVMNADGTEQHQLTTDMQGENYPAWSPDGMQIVFRAGPDNQGELYLFDVASENIERLTNDAVEDSYPAWSPDGTQLVYTHEGNVWLMDANGENSTLLMEKNRQDDYIFDLAWSPDGTQLAMVYAPAAAVWGGAVLRLYVNTLDGESEQLLAAEGLFSSPNWLPGGDEILYTNRSVIARRPARAPTEALVEAVLEPYRSARDLSWSPDGAYLVIDTGSNLALMEAGGANVRLLTDDGTSRAPDWSSGGKRIVFESTADGDHEIYSMDADGANRQQLTDNEVDDRDPAWSPDGLQIVFVSGQDGQHNVYVMDADGANPRQLTDDGGSKWGVEWSPDGKKLAFFAEGDGGVLTMNVDGSDLRTEAQIAGIAGNDLAWSPDSKWLAFAHGFNSISIVRANGDGEIGYELVGWYADWTR